MKAHTLQKSQRIPGTTQPGRRTWWLASVVGLLGLLMSQSLAADSFRCGRKLVRNGDSQSQLLSTCGEPQRRDSAQEALWIGSKKKNVRVQRWYYKTSGRSLERVVLLYQGEIVAVHTGKR